MRSNIDKVVERTRKRIDRVTPEQAAVELTHGALLVDTRNEAHRAEHGTIPGALAIDRSVLEWRLDPTSPWRIPQATGPDVRIVVMCAQGYSSSLAAASLKRLGLTNVADVIGGFEAWQAAGLQVERPSGSSGQPNA